MRHGSWKADQSERKKTITRTVRTLGPLLFLVLMCATITALMPRFLTFDNLLNVLRQTSPIAIVAVGMTYIIIAGGIDLSVGSTMGLCAVVSASVLTATNGNVLLAILVPLGVGLMVGLIIGLIISKTKITPFIVTLAAMLAIKGITYVTTSGRLLKVDYGSFKFIGQGYCGPVPVPVVVMVAIYALGMVILNHTQIGGYLYAVGGNENAARSSGINIFRVKLFAYCITGILVGMSAVITVARVGFAVPTIGQGVELSVIAAAVLGGTSLQGGRGSVIGTLIGALTMGVLANGLVLLRVSPFYQEVIRGITLLVIIMADRVLHQSRYRLA
jgi:ribose transport system permease protein